MNRYSSRSKINKYMTRANVDARKGAVNQYAFGQVVPDVVSKLDELYKQNEVNKDVYNRASKFIADNNLNDIMMPSFGAFVRGETAKYKDFNIGVDSLFALSYKDDPDLMKLIDKLGLKSENKLYDELSARLNDSFKKED